MPLDERGAGAIAQLMLHGGGINDVGKQKSDQICAVRVCEERGVVSKVAVHLPIGCPTMRLWLRLVNDFYMSHSILILALGVARDGYGVPALADRASANPTGEIGLTRHRVKAELHTFQMRIAGALALAVFL